MRFGCRADGCTKCPASPFRDFQGGDAHLSQVGVVLPPCGQRIPQQQWMGYQWQALGLLSRLEGAGCSSGLKHRCPLF